MREIKNPFKDISDRHAVRRAEKTKINIAVVGPTSAGKTYLLKDIKESLESYVGNGEPYGVQGLSSFGEKADGNGKRPIDKTILWPCREEDICGNRFKDKKNKKFALTFLDIPGECIDNNHMSLFNDIRNNLTNPENRNQQMFVEYTLTRNGSRDKKAVYFVGNDADSDARRKELDAMMGKWNTTLASAPMTPAERDAKLNSFASARTSSYLQKRDQESELGEEEYLKLKGYKVKKAVGKKVSCEEFFNNFMSYNTDLAINALFDALTTIGRPRIVTELLYSSLELKIKDVITRKERQVKMFFFYFYYYIMKATDVVICKRFVFESEEEARDTLDFDDFIGKLQAIRQDNDEEKMRVRNPYHIVFKGIDRVINRDYFSHEELRDGTPGTRNALSDAMYTFMLRDLLRLLYPDVDDYGVEREAKYFNVDEKPSCWSGLKDRVWNDIAKKMGTERLQYEGEKQAESEDAPMPTTQRQTLSVAETDVESNKLRQILKRMMNFVVKLDKEEAEDSLPQPEQMQEKKAEQAQEKKLKALTDRLWNESVPNDPNDQENREYFIVYSQRQAGAENKPQGQSKDNGQRPCLEQMKRMMSQLIEILENHQLDARAEDREIMHIPPHVYFAGMPIDRRYHIYRPYRQDEENERLSKDFCGWNDATSAMFGTRQLTCGILYRHDLTPDVTASNLMYYIYGLQR